MHIGTLHLLLLMFIEPRNFVSSLPLIRLIRDLCTCFPETFATRIFVKKSPSAGFSSPSPCMSEVQRVRLSRSSCKVRALNVIGRPPPISVGQKVLDRFNFSSRLWTFFLPLLSSKLTVHVTQKQQCGSSWGKAPAWSECCPCKTPPTMCPAPQSRRQMLPEIFQSFRQLLNGEKMQCLKMS